MKTGSGRPAFQGIHRLCARVPWARGSFSRKKGAVICLVILAEEPPAEVRAQLEFFDILDEEMLYSFTRVYRVEAEPRILPFIRLASIEPDEVGRALHPGDLVAWPLPERLGRKSRWIVMLA